MTIFPKKSAIITLFLLSVLLLKAQNPGQTMIEIGKKYLGYAYESNTLDFNETEFLIIDSVQFDCVTYVEWVLAKSLQNKYQHKITLDSILTRLRYRDGKMSGYESRLHYFSEWLLQAEKYGTGKNISLEMGGEKRIKYINYMSANKHKYPKIRHDSTLQKIKEVEYFLSNKNIPFISNRVIPRILTNLRDGDIIALASSLNGLDISHTGFIVFVHEKPHLLHASYRTKKVEISKLPLDQYIKTLPFIEGIIVFRAQ